MHFTTLKEPVGHHWQIQGELGGPPPSPPNIPIKPKDVLSNEVTALKLK